MYKIVRGFLFNLVVVPLFALILSCSSEPDENPPSNGAYGSQAMENGPVYQRENDEQYIGEDLTIYLADERNKQGQPILTEETMLMAGTMSNGEVSLRLPNFVDSRFLQKINSAPEGLSVKPLGVEIWFYTDPLRLINNDGSHIGNLRYFKIVSEIESHIVYYWYFSKATKINGTRTTENSRDEYKIDAKQGWNKVYTHLKFPTNRSDETYITTDLSKVPSGLKWIIDLH
jgi:hypothetical protein